MFSQNIDVTVSLTIDFALKEDRQVESVKGLWF